MKHDPRLCELATICARQGAVMAPEALRARRANMNGLLCATATYQNLIKAAELLIAYGRPEQGSYAPPAFQDVPPEKRDWYEENKDLVEEAARRGANYAGANGQSTRFKAAWNEILEIDGPLEHNRKRNKKEPARARPKQLPPNSDFFQ